MGTFQKLKHQEFFWFTFGTLTFTYIPAGILSEHLHIQSSDFRRTEQGGENRERTLSLFVFEKFTQKSQFKRSLKSTENSHISLLHVCFEHMKQLEKREGPPLVCNRCADGSPRSNKHSHQEFFRKWPFTLSQNKGAKHLLMKHFKDQVICLPFSKITSPLLASLHYAFCVMAFLSELHGRNKNIGQQYSKNRSVSSNSQPCITLLEAET